MSDPVNKVEDVEDVLSSIRRLVADTSSSSPSDAETSSDEVETVAPPQEALILTSEQRIHREKPDEELSVSSLTALRQAVADPDAASNKVVSAGWVRPVPDDYYEDEAEEAASGWAEAQMPFEGPNVDEGEAAERPAFAPLPQSEEDMDLAPQDEEANTAEPIWPEEVDQPSPDTFSRGRAQSSLAEAMGVATFVRSGNEADVPAAEIEEAIVVDIPDDEDADEISSENILTDQPVFEDGILDEDTLRKLVSEVVREELGGELGERITRNVRKLVRREIHRALTARELE